MKQRTRRRLQNYGVLLLILLALAWVATRFWGFTSSTFTDNAHVERRVVPVISRVQGFVQEVRFDDFTPVHRGDTLVVIDNTEHLVRLAQARADLARAGAGRSVSQTSVSTSLNNVSVNNAAVAEVKVLLDNAAADLARYQGLLDAGAVTRREYDDVKARHDALVAKYTMLTRQSHSAELVNTEQRGNLDRETAVVEMAQAALRLAEINLGYTVITAPCDGYCSRRSIEPGQMVNPGQLLLDITDAASVWVTANYREKQTARMAIGDSVKVEVDAIPGVSFHGVIEQIAPTTGARAAGRTDETAMGNFVRVEQRIPVKISLDVPGNSPAEFLKLRAGMNAECKVLR